MPTASGTAKDEMGAPFDRLRVRQEPAGGKGNA
jgi:hypothetical protein